MKNFNIILANLLFAGVFTSCTKEVFYQDDQQLPKFINAILITGQTTGITVGSTVDVTDSIFFKYDCDLELNLSMNNNKIELVKQSNIDGCTFMTLDTIEPNKSYQLSATTNGVRLTASTQTLFELPFSHKIKNIRKIVSFTNPLNNKIRNCYEVTINLDLQNINLNSIKHLAFSALPFNSDADLKPSLKMKKYDGINSYEGVLFKPFFMLDTVGTQNSFEAEVTFCTESDDENYEFYLNSIHLNDDLYNYLKKYQEHITSAADPFSIPSKSYSNIENGVGIFGSMSIHSKSASVKLPR